MPIAWVGCCCWAVVGEAADKGSAYFAALESITAGDLGHYVDYLADERLEGREAGTRSGRAAGDYLAERLAKLPLGAAGTEGFFQPFPSNYRNVLAILKGSDPQLSSQVIIVGAHYDHVGYGNRSNSRGPIGKIHPGADDNASGTSGVLKLAEAFTLLADHPKRSILFVLFDAEEEGLFGSQYWTDHPTVPLAQVAAMLDMDMIGRLRNEHVMIFGTRTAGGLRRLLSQQNDPFGLWLEFPWGIKPEGDFYPFFDRGIPALMFHTGLHDEYHSPRDVAALIDRDGMSRVVRMVFAVAYELAESAAVPAVRRQAESETERAEKELLRRVPKLPDRLGIRWQTEPGPTDGVRLMQVLPNSPAEQGQLRAGDRIVRFAGRGIHCDADLIAAVRSAESPAVAQVQRPGQEGPLELLVPLHGEPMRVGITWRTDDAEPGAVILTYVVPGSPAAEAGLEVGDRIYRVAGEDFADEQQFAARVKVAAETVALLVERDGRQWTAVLRLAAEPLRRAA